MSTLRRYRVPVLASLLFLYACKQREASLGEAGDAAGESTPQRADAGKSTPERADAGAADAGTMTPCAEDKPEPGELCVSRVVGRLVAENGELPPAKSQVTVCGAICYGGSSDAEGRFVVNIDHFLAPSEYSVLLHGAPDFAGFYFPVPEQVVDGVLDVGDLHVFHLPSAGQRIPDQTSETVVVTAQGVSLQVPANSKTQFDFESFGHGELGFEFRALQLEPKAAALATDVRADVFYAFSPFETWFAAAEDTRRKRLKIGMIFPNAPGFDPGQAVEFLALGSYLYVDYVAAAEFAVVATGAVSEDGKSIEMSAGEGVELLTWLAIRRLDR